MGVYPQITQMGADPEKSFTTAGARGVEPSSPMATPSHGSDFGVVVEKSRWFVLVDLVR